MISINSVIANFILLTTIPMKKQYHGDPVSNTAWIPLTTSLKLIFTRKRLFLWSAILVFVTFGLTWLGFLLSVDLMDKLTGNFINTPPDTDTILGWIKHKGWVVAKWLFLIISKIIAFYVAFIIAYTITTPGYSFLSAAAEKMYAGEHFDPDANFTLAGILVDIFEGLKIAFFGIIVTVAALLVNFIPGIGQVLAFLLYTYYSTLMFIDFPTSRRRWRLGRKLGWLRQHSSQSFRIGVGPALISMIPLINIFAMAILFPILTVHSSLNFAAIEVNQKLNQRQ